MLGVEGQQRGDWVLVDAGDVIVHLFRPEVRDFYGLEKMWGVKIGGETPLVGGLDVEDDYSDLVDVRRLMLAGTAPAFMQSEGDPRYLAACLLQLENAIDRLHLK